MVRTMDGILWVHRRPCQVIWMEHDDLLYTVNNRFAPVSSQWILLVTNNCVSISSVDSCPEVSFHKIRSKGPHGQPRYCWTLQHDSVCMRHKILFFPYHYSVSCVSFDLLFRLTLVFSRYWTLLFLFDLALIHAGWKSDNHDRILFH